MRNSLYLLLLLLSTSCINLAGDSKNEVLYELKNSEGLLKVSVVEKHGGATVRNSLHIFMVKSQKQIGEQEGGNVFVADLIEGVDLELDIDIKWISDSKVKIHYPKSLRVFKEQQQVAVGNKTIEIEFIKN